MKKILLSLVVLLFTLSSCDVAQNETTDDKVKVSFNVGIPGTSSRNLSAIASPTVNYTINKGTQLYQTANNVPLVKTSTNGYRLDLLLVPGNTYSFTQFDVYDGLTLTYKLDYTKTSDSFTVSSTGVITPSPANIYLMYQLGDGYPDVPAEIGIMEVKTDYQVLRNLTFKVTVPTETTVEVQHKLNFSTWATATSAHTTSLSNGAVYDMDTRALQDFSVEGDDNVATVGGTTNASDEFRFLVTKGSETSIIYFSSADFNQKDIIFK